jgi:DNA-binding NtrC family response regulator
MSLDKIVTISRDTEVHQLARKHAREVFGADDPADAMEIAQTINPSLVLCDYRYNPTGIREFLQKADNSLNDVPVVVVGGNGDTDCLIEEFAKVEGYHFLETSKDYDRLEEIVEKIKFTYDNAKSESECEIKLSKYKGDASRFFVDDLSASVSMVGKSRSVLNTLRMIRIVAESQCNPILIVGETGTGKELAAKAIHTLRHPNQPFVAVNCAA